MRAGTLLTLGVVALLGGVLGGFVAGQQGAASAQEEVPRNICVVQGDGFGVLAGGSCDMTVHMPEPTTGTICTHVGDPDSGMTYGATGGTLGGSFGCSAVVYLPPQLGARELDLAADRLFQQLICGLKPKSPKCLEPH